MFKQHTNDFSVIPNHGCDSTIIECINITDGGSIDVSSTDFSINNSPFHIENVSGSPITTLDVANMPIYETNTAATAGGLTLGTIYRTSTGQLMVRY